ncbi:hypothetical protein Y032_0073g787 [Ancylostoma ceylanicum]|uniref:Uncharacterized protein n=1 Tax=Ancylostoma ceylanicum TaxID=53326 RepID=A0A016TX54_9BILA|nr:hypothetical protein Y032_0073g787 [Ancylostoma ceylanicum]
MREKCELFNVRLKLPKTSGFFFSYFSEVGSPKPKSTGISEVSEVGIPLIPAKDAVIFARRKKKGGAASRALWLSAAPLEAPGNHDVSVFFRIFTRQARFFDAADNQSARVAVPLLVYDRLEFTVGSSPERNSQGEESFVLANMTYKVVDLLNHV